MLNVSHCFGSNSLAVCGEHLVSAGLSLRASSKNKPADIPWNFVGMVADAPTIVSVYLPFYVGRPFRMTEWPDGSPLRWCNLSGELAEVAGRDVTAKRD